MPVHLVFDWYKDASAQHKKYNLVFLLDFIASDAGAIASLSTLRHRTNRYMHGESQVSSIQGTRANFYLGQRWQQGTLDESVQVHRHVFWRAGDWKVTYLNRGCGDLITSTPRPAPEEERTSLGFLHDVGSIPDPDLRSLQNRPRGGEAVVWPGPSSSFRACPHCRQPISPDVCRSRNEGTSIQQRERQPDCGVTIISTLDALLNANATKVLQPEASGDVLKFGFDAERCAVSWAPAPAFKSSGHKKAAIARHGPSSSSPISPARLGAGMAGTTSASVTDTYGAFLIGTYCALMLYGLVLHQSYHYYRVYAADARWIKALVTVTLILETIVTALNMNAAYNYLVTNYANSDLERPLWSLKASFFPAIVALTCQTFFARRVWLIGRRYRPIVYCSVVLMLAEFALPAACTIKMHVSPSRLLFQAHNITEALDFSYLVSARNAAATVADSFMTAVLIYSLQRSRTGIKRTDSMINVLVLYAINTGLLISAFNVLCLIFGFVFPQSFTYIAMDLVASRLYANSLLAALTSRKLIAESSHVYTEADGPFGTVYAVSGPASSPLRAHSTRPAANEEWELPQMGKVLNIQSQSQPEHILGSPGEGSGKSMDGKPAKSVFLHSV
ncbi:hypothetical protein GSI_05511 [Ganoderma sinense ZZ0214-1]|uniref:DUF6534 domain-containing protein n=1 Tax=Ganoderma sinense ZZ0214-1 TaxID=1077348 RepID=A0A2G8SES3_9APHY|nr:hypothetical protein GSI_05511 [Ganoderma sinense ZZ0214-1]